MFKFSTNTIINSVNDYGFANVPTAADGSNAIASHKRFWVETTDKNNPILRIARHFKFAKNNVVAVYKRHWEKPQLFEVTFDLSNLDTSKEGEGRIALYIGLSGSQNSYYSNDFVFKGKPFFIEFPIHKGDTAANIAKRIVNIAKKYQNMVYEYPLVNVVAGEDNSGNGGTDDSGTVIFKGTDEYQVVRMAELQYYNEEAQSYDCCAKFGAFEDEAPGVVVKQGHEGFGTYRQMIKDLRLPTAANTRWNRIVQDETPLIDGHYNEYIIKMCVNRGIMGSDAVGEVTKSLTNHVFYVLDGDVSTAFEAALTAAGLTSLVETVDKDYDDVTLTDEQIENSYDNPTNVVNAEDTAHSTNKANNSGFTARKIADGERGKA